MVYARYETPLGPLWLGYEDETLLSLRIQPGSAAPEGRTPFADEVCRQVLEYLSGLRRAFDIPYEARGTGFQRAVWDALTRIPYGDTRTYGRIAREVGRDNAARAVGAACARNPLWLIVPCHRVVGADGSLTGYAGGVALKRALLEIERKNGTGGSRQV